MNAACWIAHEMTDWLPYGISFRVPEYMSSVYVNFNRGYSWHDEDGFSEDQSRSWGWGPSPVSWWGRW